MGEFFKGWRRKFGALTLVMSLAITALWIRGYTYTDTLLVNDGTHNPPSFTFCRFGVMWETRKSKFLLCDHRGYGWQHTSILESDSFHPDWPLPPETKVPYPISFHRRWRCCGFYFAKWENPLCFFEFALIPYWAFVLPFTLLSAYLLVTKSHQGL